MGVTEVVDVANRRAETNFEDVFKAFYSYSLVVVLQLRRGADTAEIYSLAFSQNAQWLALSSDKGTVHVFSLRAAGGTEDIRAGEAPQAVTGVSPPKAASNVNGNGNGGGSPIAGSSLLSFGSGNPGSRFSFMKGIMRAPFSPRVVCFYPSFSP